MARINITLGSKGGIGKTLVAAMITQYLLRTSEKNIICMDLDWINRSFCHFKALNVIALDLDTNGELEKRKFDIFVENIAESAQDDVFIIDCGGNTYSHILNYMKVNDVPALLLEMGHELLFHVPIAGGGNLEPSMQAFSLIAQEMPEAAPLALWINPFYGVIEMDGKQFEEFKAYKKSEDRVRNIIYIPNMHDDMKFNMARMMMAGQTFDEAKGDKSLRIMDKQRLLRAYNLMAIAIEASGVCE